MRKTPSSTGALGRTAPDLSLLTQGEVAEAQEPHVAGLDGSSAMAHKRNPTGCQGVLSSTQRALGPAATLLAVLPQEHERGLGGWQAEGSVPAELFELTHGALAALLPVVDARGRSVRHGPQPRRSRQGHDLGESEALVAAALAAYVQI